MPASPCPFLEFYCVGCDVLPSPVRRCLHCLHASASKSGQLNCATCGRTVQHQDPKTSAARQQGRTTNARHANTSRSCRECEREKDSAAHGSSQIANMTTGSADTHHAVAAVLLVVVEPFSRAERLVRCDDARLFSSAAPLAQSHARLTRQGYRSQRADAYLHAGRAEPRTRTSFPLVACLSLAELVGGSCTARSL